MRTLARQVVVTVAVACLTSVVGGCSRLVRHDKAGAAVLASATGLGSDMPPIPAGGQPFVPTFAGATPGSSSGPGLVPVVPKAGGTGSFWLTARGGKGLSEAAMVSFYVERMMQHNIDRIQVICTDKQPLDVSQQSRNVEGWGGDQRRRFFAVARWSGMPSTGWSVSQELVVERELVTSFDPAKGKPDGKKIVEHDCHFVPEQVVRDLANTYNYMFVPFKQPQTNPNDQPKDRSN